MLQGKRRVNPFRMPIARPKRVGPEHNPWYWHPFRVGVRSAPEEFTKKLLEVDPELACTWNPVKEHWSIWMRKPSIQNPICQGWALLFNVPPRELDERVFARLYEASARKWGNGREYFRRIEAEFERDRQKREATRQQEARDIAGDYYDFTQIKVSMRGPSSGSKFANNHSE
jgi:hypothetical protein